MSAARSTREQGRVVYPLIPHWWLYQVRRRGDGLWEVYHSREPWRASGPFERSEAQAIARAANRVERSIQPKESR